MSGKHHTFELTPELLKKMISLLEEIEVDRGLLTEKVCHPDTLDLGYHKEGPDRTVDIFNEVFEKMGLVDVIASKIEEEAAAAAAAINLKAEEVARLKEVADKATVSAMVAVENYNKANEE